MKPKYRRIWFRDLPREVQQEFLAGWAGMDKIRERGWRRYVSDGCAYIMNRRDEWYAAKPG